MGQKVNPIGFRTGIVRGWQSRWYASKQDFASLLLEDHRLRNFIKNHPTKPQYRQAGVDRIEIERTRDEVKVVLHVARPGLIIGKKGQDVETLQERQEGDERRDGRVIDGDLHQRTAQLAENDLAG